MNPDIIIALIMVVALLLALWMAGFGPRMH